MPRLRRYRPLLPGLLLLLPFAIIAIVPGWIAPHGPNELIDSPFLRPSGTYLLGTDEVGRDELSRLIWAAHTDLKISLASTVVAALIGIFIGLASGYRGGLIDSVVLRASDVMLAFPSLLLAIFLVAVFGSGDLVLITALALLFVPGFIRVSRGLALALRTRAFIESSLISGGGTRHVVWRHLLPNAAGPLLVAISLTASYALLAAATLSYLGLGTQIPTASWGNMLQTAFNWVFGDAWLGLFPGVCIVLVSLGYTTLASGIERVLRESGRVTRSEAQAALGGGALGIGTSPSGVPS